MDVIATDFAGLTALAACCDSQAARMCSASTPPHAGAEFQASSAAVAAVHADAQRAETGFADRLRFTASAVQATASSFAATDVNSSGRIAAVAASGRVQMAGSAVPTLSQIRTWDFVHLEAAAGHWQARGAAWQTAYDEVYRQVPAPGGTPWEGAAADAARSREPGCGLSINRSRS